MATDVCLQDEAWYACKNNQMLMSSWLLQSCKATLGTIFSSTTSIFVRLFPLETWRVRAPTSSAYLLVDHSFMRNCINLVLLVPFDRNVFHWRGQGCWRLFMARRTYLSLPRLLLSVFSIDKSECWLATKSTLVAVPAGAKISVRSISARSAKWSGTL